MKRIVAIGSANIIGLLKDALGNNYNVINGNYNEVVHYSHKRIVYFAQQIYSADIVYFMGITNFTGILARIARIMNKKVIFHWLGTDVWKCLQGENHICKKSYLADKHLAYSENLKEELTTFGIDAEVYTLSPSGLSLKAAKMPSEHAVLLSIPDATKEFYGYNELVQVIQRFPELPFYVVRSERPDFYPWKNIKFCGILDRKEMDEIYDKISITIRYPLHDGLSLIMMESTIKGKEMIYKFNHPYSNKVSSCEEICETLERILKKKPEVNLHASEYGINNYSQEVSTRNGIRIINEMLGAI